MIENLLNKLSEINAAALTTTCAIALLVPIALLVGGLWFAIRLSDELDRIEEEGM